MFPTLPDPLHPAVVHLPIALAILVPFGALLATVLIYKGFLPARTWAAIVLLQAVLAASAWMALETGEDQEDRVERIVAERHIEGHEDAAKRFLILSAIGLVLVAAGLMPGRRGHLGRIAGTVTTFVVLGAAVPVGHTGGELVYKHGAAGAYVDGSSESARPRPHDD